MNEQTMIEDIKAYAIANYNNGWDNIVECWEDGDILEALSENEFDMAKTIASIQEYVDVIVERDTDAANSAF
jgi:hypothetical protein